MHAISETVSQGSKAVIYCRVSGKKQTTEGSGLSSQEYRCRQYAAAKGYDVEEVFPDDVSGGGDFINRPGMVALLRYLDERSDQQYIVIFDDLKRYARDVEFHLKLRRLMHERGAIRECLNFNFEDSPEGKLNETVTAAAGAYERESMARQNRQKSIARIEQGYWVFRAPVGYRYDKSPRGGKELVLNEPLASTVREALEGYATRRFASQTEVRRFLEADPNYPKDKPNGEIRSQTIVRLLRKVVYAGYVEAPMWGISPRKGNHPGIISFETHRKIRNRLDAGVYAPTRKDISDDFPLRGAVACDCCNTLLTAGWSKGMYKKYAYYHFRDKDCQHYGKSIPRAKIEAEFATLLSEIQPSHELMEMASAMFKDCWKQLASQASELSQVLKRNVSQADKDIDQLVQRAVKASNSKVIAAYEKNIESLENEKLVLMEKIANPGRTRHSFDTLFELSMRFLASPCKLWDSGRIDLQKMVLRMTFLEPVQYNRENGFLNCKTSLPFNMLGGSLTPCRENGARGRI
ncbi:MAG: recombinase family protein [Alphaproteobacteria bacterium]